MSSPQGTPVMDGGAAREPEKSGFGVSLVRMAQVFHAPVEMFRGMASRCGWSDWLLPMVAGVVASILVGMMVFPHLDLQSQAREQMEAAGLAPDQVEARLETQRAFMEGPLGQVMVFSNVITYPAILLILALIFWGGATVLGGSPGYGRVLAILAYSWLPKLLEGGLMVFVLQGREAVRPDRLAGVLATNPASYLDPAQGGTPLYAFMGALNPFTLWVMALVALGLSGAGRLSRGAAFTLVAALYAVWILIQMGWAAIF